MTEAEMLELMANFRRAYGRADGAGLAAVTSNDFAWHQHEGDAPQGRVLNGIDELLAEITRRGEDLSYENMVERAAGTDLLVQTFTISGMDKGTPFHAKVVDLYPVKEGRITRKDTYWKYQR